MFAETGARNEIIVLYWCYVSFETIAKSSPIICQHFQMCQPVSGQFPLHGDWQQWGNSSVGVAARKWHPVKHCLQRWQVRDSNVLYKDFARIFFFLPSTTYSPTTSTWTIFSENAVYLLRPQTPLPEPEGFLRKKLCLICQEENRAFDNLHILDIHLFYARCSNHHVTHYVRFSRHVWDTSPIIYSEHHSAKLTTHQFLFYPVLPIMHGDFCNATWSALRSLMFVTTAVWPRNSYLKVFLFLPGWWTPSR